MRSGEECALVAWLSEVEGEIVLCGWKRVSIGVVWEHDVVEIVIEWI